MGKTVVRALPLAIMITTMIAALCSIHGVGCSLLPTERGSGTLNFQPMTIRAELENTSDQAAPQIVSTKPLANATAVPLITTIEITFNEPINASVQNAISVYDESSTFIHGEFEYHNTTHNHYHSSFHH